MIEALLHYTPYPGVIAVPILSKCCDLPRTEGWGCRRAVATPGARGGKQ